MPCLQQDIWAFMQLLQKVRIFCLLHALLFLNLVETRLKKC